MIAVDGFSALGGARSIRTLHRAPRARARHCCPTRAGPVPFIKIAPHVSARCPCRQCGGPRAVSQPQIGIFAPFSEFLHIKGLHFPDFFHSSLLMTPMNHEKFHENRSARFSEIRNTDTQTDRRGSFIYIDDEPLVRRFPATSYCYRRLAVPLPNRWFYWTYKQ